MHLPSQSAVTGYDIGDSNPTTRHHALSVVLSSNKPAIYSAFHISTRPTQPAAYPYITPARTAPVPIYVLMVLLAPEAFLADLSRVFSACQKGSVFITIKAQAARKVSSAPVILYFDAA